MQGVVELWNTLTSRGAKNSTNLASRKASLLQWKMEATWLEMYKIFPVTRDTAAANMSWKGRTRSGEDRQRAEQDDTDLGQLSGEAWDPASVLIRITLLPL